jgi:hypothetical protein
MKKRYLHINILHIPTFNRRSRLNVALEPAIPDFIPGGEANFELNGV